MRDLDDALSDIRTMRAHIARSTQFRGYSAQAFAATGVLALATATAQSYWIANPVAELNAFLALWVATACIAATIIGVDVIVRSRRAHSGLADEMIYAALEQLLPAGVAAALLTCVIARFAPQSAWMLPGLWQILLGLGVFASCRLLPAPLIAIAVWYLASGLTCLALTADANALAPLTMGVPFVIGQLLAAALIHRFGGSDADE